MNVCGVLSRLTEVNGKKVTIQGTWSRADSGQELQAEAPCARPTVVDGWQFWDTIKLVPGETMDRFALAGIYAKFRRILRAHPEGIKVIATFSGRLETRGHFDVRTFPSGEQHPIAFDDSVALMRFTHVSGIHGIPWRTEEAEAQADRQRRPCPTRVS